jgi:hypothetical protein
LKSYTSHLIRVGRLDAVAIYCIPPPIGNPALESGTFTCTNPQTSLGVWGGSFGFLRDFRLKGATCQMWPSRGRIRGRKRAIFPPSKRLGRFCLTPATLPAEARLADARAEAPKSPIRPGNLSCGGMELLVRRPAAVRDLPQGQASYVSVGLDRVKDMYPKACSNLCSHQKVADMIRSTETGMHKPGFVQLFGAEFHEAAHDPRTVEAWNLVGCRPSDPQVRRRAYA